MYDITVGDEYWISKLNGEQWEDMPTNIVWNDLGIQIRAGSYHEFNCNLNLFGNFDEDEKYRITKKVYVNQKEYTLYADFTVAAVCSWRRTARPTRWPKTGSG